jgi:hypothetical protein
MKVEVWKFLILHVALLEKMKQNPKTRSSNLKLALQNKTKVVFSSLSVLSC